ncbi:MAG: SPOR domain-containing protein [Candidatus Calescibacterium sp.]|jgi:cell division septation protein DedD|nr:SPOR domain-containing protein [Candidatus Calescibacterium sp.]
MEEKGFDFKGYVLAFLVFLISGGISFFVGMKIGKNIAREELRKEIMKARESGIDDMIKRVFESAEKKAESEIEKKGLKQEKVQVEAGEGQAKITDISEGVKISSSGEKKIGDGGEKLKQKEERNLEQKEEYAESEKGRDLGVEKSEEVSEGEKKEAKSKDEVNKIPSKSEKAQPDKTTKSEKTVKKELVSAKTGKVEEQKLSVKNWWESGGRWTVQVASFNSDIKAQKLAEILKREYGFPSYVLKAKANGKDVFRVRVGKFKSRDDAEKALKILNQKGFEGIVTY